MSSVMKVILYAMCLFMHAMRWRRGMDLEKFAVAGESALSLKYRSPPM